MGWKFHERIGRKQVKLSDGSIETVSGVTLTQGERTLDGSLIVVEEWKTADGRDAVRRTDGFEIGGKLWTVVP